MQTNLIRLQPQTFFSGLIQKVLFNSGVKTNTLKQGFSFGFRKNPANIPGFAVNGHKIITTRIEDRNIRIISPEIKDTDKVILYLHGGDYRSNITRNHWRFIFEISRRTGATVIVPEYPLAPESNYRETYDFLEDMYCNLFQGTEPANIIFAGDTAGGGLALGLARQLRYGNKKQPSAIILISPWLDLTLSNPGILSGHDQATSNIIRELQEAGRTFAGNLDPADPRVSPIYGDFSDLGKISVFSCRNELYHADASKLVARLAEQGIPAEFHEYTGFAGVGSPGTGLAESRDIPYRINELIHRHL